MTNNYYEKFIDFFQRHNLYDKNMFDYLNSNSSRFDYRDTDWYPYIGCFFVSKRDKLESIHLIVPYLDSDITNLINIHEYIHGITIYQKLGKKLKEEDLSEALPLLYERIYVEENKDNKPLTEYHNKVNNIILSDNRPIYKKELIIQDELYDYYINGHYDKADLQRKAKKLVRKRP